MRTKAFLRGLAFVVASLATMSSLRGYILHTDASGIYVVKWQTSPVELQIKLPAAGKLSDGNTLSSSVAAAFPIWNAQLGTVQLSPVVSQATTYANGNGINEIAMDSTVDGDAFPAGTIAITTSYNTSNASVETDITFNSAYTWDSYRGSLHTTPTKVYDIQRVAIHELGHVLGLGHPDEHGQTVTAIMNSAISSIATLQPDDIAGAQKLYGAPGFVPANDNFANATVITLQSGTVQLTGTNIAATRETGEPNHVNVAQGHSVWWKWTAPSAGSMAITTLGSDFDTVLAAYTGTTLTTLSEVASNDDVTQGVVRTSAVTFNAISGTTYYIAVDGWGDMANGRIPYTGSVTLNLSFGGNVPPIITSQPSSLARNAGEQAQFSVQSSGSPTPAYQWQRLPVGEASWINVPNTGSYAGTTTATLTVSATTVTMSGDQFRCVASNAGGSATSNPATLTVNAVPLPTLNQPYFYATQTANVVSITASGYGPFTYQWYHNGAPMPGANSNQLSVVNAAGREFGEYFVAVTNIAGTVLSKTASLGLTGSFNPLTDYSWIKAMEVDGVVYFLFKSPAQIARYDLASESWLSAWPLAQIATDFTLATDAIYVAVGTNVVRYDRSFASPTTLITGPNAITSLQQVDGYLVTLFYQYPYTTFASYDRITGQAISSLKQVYALEFGTSYDPTTRRFYGRTSGSPSDIDTMLVRNDGTFGVHFDSPYHGQFPAANQTFVMGTGEAVADNSGVVYSASDLSYAGSFGGWLTDVIPDGNSGYYVLRGGRISSADSNYRETGATAGHLQATRIWRRNGNLFLFAQPTGSGALPAVEKVAAASLLPAALTAAADPAAGNYQSAQLLGDENGVVYIYSKLDRNIYRWSSLTLGYLPSIPLASTPSYFAYSAETRSIYFEENGYQIRRIALDSGDVSPKPLAVAPVAPTGVQTAGGLLMMAMDGVQTSVKFRLLLASTGSVANLGQGGERSREYAWCAATRRMYHFRDDVSPNALIYEQYDQTGNLVAGTSGASTGIVPPIRVSADGALVALGSGAIHDGVTLTQLGTLANAFSDATWSGGGLHTVRSVGDKAEIQSWSASSLQLLRDRSFSGVPVRLLTLPDGRLLLVTSAAGALSFRVVDPLDLQTVYASESSTKTQQSINFDALPDRNYGAAPFGIVATASSGLPVSFNVTSGPATLSDGTVTITGAGIVTIRASQAGNATYDSAVSVARSFTVMKPTLLVTAQDKARTYGAANPALTVSYSGFLNNDTPSVLTTLPAITTTASVGSRVGSYPITASGGASATYAFSYLDGTLTVSKAPLTVRADNLFRIQGAANPPLTLSYTGFVNGQSSTALSTQPVASTTATTTSPLGNYPITVSGGSADNYALTLVNGTLTVGPPSFAGIYFGTFASGGYWALYVRANNTATYIAYLPSRHSAIVVNFTVGTDGTFTATGTEIVPLANAAVSSLALAAPETPVLKTATAASAFTLIGQIGFDGAITGQLSGLGENFTGAADSATGSAPAGLYTAATLNSASGATYTIVGASGQAVIVTTTPADIDGAAGTLNASGQLTATTSNNAALSVTINPSAQSMSASLTLAGSTTPITYAGFADTYTPVVGGHLVNLSSRAAVGTGDNVLIVGFVITGAAPKPVIIRGVGPALAVVPFSLTGTLPDPVFDLYHSGAVVGHNDNWATAGDPVTVAAAMARVGAFSLPAGSSDSVISTPLNPGVYSAILYGNGTANTGVGMVEIYDSTAALDPTTPRMVNISSRGLVGTGDNVLIGGFVVTGDQPRQVLIRGVGPTLTTLGVTGTVLADPILYLYHSSAVINQNDNWGSAGDGAAISAAASAVGAFALPSGSKDAALLTALQPGVYSVIVAGVGNTTGIALVEVYEVGN